MSFSRNQKNLSCCICAGQGHTAEYCRSPFRLSDMKLAPMRISSYEQCYTNTDIDNSKSAPYILFSDILEDFDFNWNVNEEPNRFYGRFLAATKFKRKPVEKSPMAKKRRSRLSANAKAKRKRLVFNPFSNKNEAEIQKQKESVKVEKSDDDKEIDVGMEENTEAQENNKPAEFTSKEVVENEEIDVVSLDVKMEEQQTVTEENFEVKIDDEEIDVGEEPKYESKMHDESKNDKIETNENDKNESKEESILSENKSQIDEKEHDSESSQIEFSFTKTFDEIEHTKNVQKFDLSFIGKLVPVSPMTSPIKNPSQHHRVQQQHCVQQQNRMQFPKRNMPTNRFEVTNINQVLPPDVTIVRPPRTSAYRKPRPIETIVSPMKSSPQDNMQNAAPRRSSIGQYPYSAATYDHSIRMIQPHSPKNVATFDNSVRMPDFIPLSNDQIYLRNPANVHRFEDSTAMPDFIPLTGHRSMSRSSISSTQTTLAPLRPFNKAPTQFEAPPPPSISKLDEDGVEIVFDTRPTTATKPNENPNEPSTSVITLSEEIETIERPCNAKIFLTKENCKYLLNGKGSDFLRDESTKNDVSVTMEYSSYGNNLNIFGLPSNQNKFQEALASFCREAEDETKRKNEVSARVPKNRQTLMKFIQDQIVQLEKPLGNARDLFVKMKISEQVRTKQGTKTADRARKTLNMILIGQAGLLEGQMHLVALMGNLRYLKELSKDVVSVNFRNQVFLHCRYIFSSFDHKNYEKLINKYEELRKNNQLPVLNLDRKLLGFKINNSGSTASTDDRLTSVDIMKMTGASGDNMSDDVKINIISDTEDIKLNVSTDNLLNIGSIKKLDEDFEMDDKNSFEQAKLKLQNSLKEEHKNPECKGEAIEVDSPKTKPIERYERLLNRMTVMARKKDNCDDEKCYSQFWSRKCLQLLERCRSLPKIKSNPNAKEKFNFVLLRARTNKLSYMDYVVLMKFVDSVK